MKDSNQMYNENQNEHSTTATKVGDFEFVETHIRYAFDWATFPEPNDDGKIARRFFEGEDAKSIGASIQRYRMKCRKKNVHVPKFKVETIKDETTQEKKGCWVYRLE